MRSRFLVLCLSLGWSTGALAATPYYVDASGGSDSNDGRSPATAWRSLAKVNNSSFDPGDSVLLKRGGQWREELIVPSSGGTGAPITIGGYGTGNNPLINGSDLVTGWSSMGSGVWKATVARAPNQVFFNGTRGVPVESQSALNATHEWHWSKKSLYIYSSSAPNTAYQDPGIEWTAPPGSGRRGILVSGPSHVTIDGVDVTRTGWDGIKASGASHRVVIQNLKISHAGNQGILFTGSASDTVVRNVQLSYNGLDSRTHGLYANAADATAGPWLVENTVAEYSGGFGFHIFEATSGTLRNSTAYANAQSGITVTDLKDDADVNVEYCISTHNGTHGIQIGGMGDNHNPKHIVNVFNSVAYGNGSSGIEIASNEYSQTTIRMQNTASVENVGVELELRASDRATLELNHNLYYCSTGNLIAYSTYYQEPILFLRSALADFQQSSGQDGNTLNLDPLFVDPSSGNFRLRSGSPATDAGIDVGLNEDLDGSTLPYGAGVDIGAYEYLSQEAGEPEIVSPPPDTTLTSGSTTFSWSANGADVTEWWFYLGTSLGGRDIVDTGSLGQATSVTVDILPTGGSQIYSRLWYRLDGRWETVDFIYGVESSSGSPEMESPNPGDTLSSSTVTFEWNANGAGVSGWWLYLGTTAGATDIRSSGNLGTALSWTVDGLPTDGRAIHARLWFQLNGTWTFNDYVYTAATLMPELLLPVPGSILTEPTPTFQWTSNGVNVTNWWLYVGSGVGRNDYFNSGALGLQTSVSVTALAAQERELYVRLWYLSTSGWQFIDYQFQAVPGE